MQKLIIILLLTVISCTTPKEKGFTINGITSGLSDSTKIYLSNRGKPLDSTIVLDDKFTFSGKIDREFEKMTIHTEKYEHFRSLWVENSIMSFDASTSFEDSEIKGSRIQLQANEYIQLTSPLKKEMKSLYEKGKKVEKSEIKDLKVKYFALQKEKKKVEQKFIRDHPDYELSAYYLDFLKHHLDKETTRTLYSNFTDKVKNNEWSKAIAFFLENAVKLKVGDKAPDFKLPMMNGKEVALSDYKGKYVLLDFWSSGCGPCRREHPNLRKAYNKYNKEGFEILAVTLDKTKSKWNKAVQKDSISWTTVGDLEGFSGKVPLTYSIFKIPTNY
uniref:TlpA disulfide reductase family protein n=1 Tax=Flammeovirga sp. OC4 TaxID=1382345 RepID=UPI000693A87B